MSTAYNQRVKAFHDKREQQPQHHYPLTEAARCYVCSKFTTDGHYEPRFGQREVFICLECLTRAYQLNN